MCLSAALVSLHADSLEDGFRNPPMSARPSIYYLLLNGYVNRSYVETELKTYKEAGVGGLCLFDMGARGPADAVPSAGPAFLSPDSVADLAHIIRIAGRLGMEVNLSVTSSWDMGGSWVKPEDGSMTLISSETQITGPRDFDGALPFPAAPKETPKDANGVPLFFKNVAVLALPDAQRRDGWEFVFELPNGIPRELDHVALYNADDENGAEPRYAKDFTVSISQTRSDSSSFHDVVGGSLQHRSGAQQFRFPKVRAKYVRLLIRNGYGAATDRVELAEFEAYTPDGANVLLSHSAKRITDGPRLLRFSSELGQLNNWSANNINDGRKSGARGSWSSAGPPPLAVRDSAKIIDLTPLVDGSGRLRWKAPPGKWTIIRYLCTNTGEHLKVPSPNSDGLATDHLSSAATERCMRYIVDRLRTAFPNFNDTALKNLYLASYEVQGQIWTPDFLEQFRARRGYDLKPFLPVLRGGLVDNDQVTDRVRYDFDKTLGEMLVDNYYRAAGKVAHDAGLLIESEAGGPGPPIHRVPVDALEALGAVDVVRGEFWPYRPEARGMWVIKETASAAHIHGKSVVHMESFTSNYHWQEGPAFLKDAADRAFCEGMNHVVWHTASHQPPEAGKPGWVYGAGTHMSQNRPWWPMMKPFLEYLGRSSFLLQQGRFVADVLYYYGDQGYNFVMPKRVDPSLGYGYDYDVTNEDALIHRLAVRDGKFVLPDGMRYEVLALPERDDIDVPVLRRIEELVRSGATVVGPKPRRSTGFYDYTRRDAEVRALAGKLWGPCDGKTVLSHIYGKGKVVWGKSLRDVLHERGVGPDFTYESANADLDYIHRSTPDAEIYFVRNKKKTWEHVQAMFRVSGRQPEVWTPDSGDIRPYPVYRGTDAGTTVPLQFAPDGSFFLVFRKHPAQPGVASVTRDGGALENASAFPALDWTSGIAFESGSYEVQFANRTQKHVRIGALPVARQIIGPWAIRFPEGMGAPPTVQFPKLISWTESSDPGIRYFSGIAEYTTEFSLGDDWLGRDRRVYLDLGALWAAADVTVNGRPLAILWKAPYRADITSAVHAGSNQLSVRVANDWANRLIGDARAPTAKRYTRTNIVRTSPEGLPWAKVDPIPSGLFGPVVLRAGEVFWK
jgi:hypothetical protein